MPSLEQRQQADRIVQAYRRGQAKYDTTVKRLRLRGFREADLRGLVASLEAADREAQQQTGQQEPPGPSDGTALINGLFREHHGQSSTGQHQDRNSQMNQWIRNAVGKG